MKSNRVRVFVVLVLIILAGIQKTSIAEDLFPFVLPWDDSSESITDISNWNEKPAGKNGFVKVIDSHLYSGEHRLRLLGVNLSFSGNLPSHADAEKLAKRMAKFGINCVRLHHMDTKKYPDGLLNQDMLTFNKEALDRLDYLIYQLKQNGIYSNLNLHVGRTYPGMPKWKKMPEYFKGIDIYYPDLIQMQKDYAKTLLTHRNSYTGLRYVDEPAIAIIEINNENSLLLEYWGLKRINYNSTPSLYISELEYQWNKWLQNRYKSNIELNKSWKDKFKKYALGNVSLIEPESLASQAAKKDWINFLLYVEKNYYNDMYNYIKNTLSAKSLIIGTQNNFSPFLTQSGMDIMDCHSYWQHPLFPGNAWDEDNWNVLNKPMSGTDNAGKISEIASYRVAGKPYVVTEYNHPAPNTYSTETIPLLAAYAALQDWDGIFIYSYAHGNNYNQQKISWFFDIAQHSVKMTTMVASAGLFRRADVIPHKREEFAYISEKEIIDQIADYNKAWINTKLFKLPEKTVLYSKTGFITSKDGATIQESVESTGINWDSVNKNVIIDSDMSKGFIGYNKDTIKFKDDVAIKSLTSCQNWSSILLTRMDKGKFTDNGRILITATGYSQNTGMQWKSFEKNSVGKEWGEAPVLVEGINAEIMIPRGSNHVEAWALDETGNRKQKLPIKEDENSSLHILKEYKTLWYEILLK